MPVNLNARDFTVEVSFKKSQRPESPGPSVQHASLGQAVVQGLRDLSPVQFRVLYGATVANTNTAAPGSPHEGVTGQDGAPPTTSSPVTAFSHAQDNPVRIDWTQAARILDALFAGSAAQSFNLRQMLGLTTPPRSTGAHPPQPASDASSGENTSPEQKPRSAFERAPVEIVTQIVDDLSVDDVSNLARTSRAMYKTLGQSAVKMSKLKRAVDLALSVQVNRLNELTPQQRAQISDAIADPRPIPLHREAEILAPLNREIERHGNSLGLRSFDEMSASAIAEIVNWPQAFQETGREAVAQKILEENRGCDALRPLLALDSSVAAHIVPQLLYWLDNGRPQNPQDQHPDLRAAPQLQGPNIGTPDAPRFIQHDDPRPPMPTFGLVAAWVFQTFMQPNPQQPRPDHFQSIALRGAISGIAECSGLRSHPDVLNGQDFRTAMFDEVKSHADRLPEKYRNQVLAHLDAQVAAIRSREGL